MKLHIRPIEHDDAVLRATRLLSWFILPFLLTGFVVLYAFPGRTERLFAWTIKPTMTPMVLASAYAGGAYFFFRARTATEWHRIEVGFIPVTLFASFLGVATILHWDRFNHRHLAFWLWSGLYFTTPFLVLGVYVLNTRRRTRPGPNDLMLSVGHRVIVAVTGAAAVGLGSFLFFMPKSALNKWPWTLTPLTARVNGSVLMLGVVGIAIALDGRWQTARLMLQVERLMVALILIAALRANDQFDGSRPLTWMLGVGLVLVLGGSIALHRSMERHATARDVAA